MRSEGASSSVGVTRPQFVEGQTVSIDLLAEEHDHREGAGRRHQAFSHGWGVVAGLELEEQEGGLLVSPGVAVDGFGRTLLLDELTSIDLGALAPGQHEVWISARRVAAGERTSPFPGQDAVAVLGVGPAIPRSPTSDAESRPTITNSEPRPWPVRLGRLMLNAGLEATSVDSDSRERLSLSTPRVIAGSGTARLTVGGTAAGIGDRIVIETRSSGTPNEAGGTSTGRGAASEQDAAAFGERIVFDPWGNCIVNGKTSIRGARAEADAESAPTGGLVVLSDSMSSMMPSTDDERHSVQFKKAQPETKATPWTMRRLASEPVTDDGNELRVELRNPGEQGDPSRTRLVIGRRDADGLFEPCLTVRADSTVVAHGTLRVEGRSYFGPISDDPSDPRFADALAQAFALGAASGAEKLERYYDPRLSIDLRVVVDSRRLSGDSRVLPGDIVRTEATITAVNTGEAPVATIVDMAYFLEVSQIPPKRTRRRLVREGHPLTVSAEQEVPASAGAGMALTIRVTARGIGLLGLEALGEAYFVVLVDALPPSE